jgi:hypothetical protein
LGLVQGRLSPNNCGKVFQSPWIFFFTLEEFDGRRTCGSIMVLKGRSGQGLSCFILEVRRANYSLCGEREDQECKKVTKGVDVKELRGGGRSGAKFGGGLF